MVNRETRSSGVVSHGVLFSQVNGTEALLGEEIDDRGKIRVRTYPVSGSLVFAGARPLAATVGYSFSKQLDAKPGLTSNGDNSDFSVDVSKPWKLPASWNARLIFSRRACRSDSKARLRRCVHGATFAHGAEEPLKPG